MKTKEIKSTTNNGNTIADKYIAIAEAMKEAKLSKATEGKTSNGFIFKKLLNNIILL